MDVRFIASVSVIAPDPAASRKLYMDALGLRLKLMGGDYFASEDVPGSRHFGVWPLSEAAQACFGTDEWPADRPVPQVSIEFDLDSADAVAAAVRELRAGGHVLIHETKTEPWGQTLARLQSPEGAIVGISYSPQMH
ncbi:MAG TPA: VOC family protein [Pseudonocardiaceae bacterium]|nr:VOC family protein [Pseudonocardiaceae bacterium]